MLTIKSVRIYVNGKIENIGIVKGSRIPSGDNQFESLAYNN